MDKSPEAFRTISEVADWLGTPTHVLRFWESRFTQVKPVKRAGGRRYYRPRDMELLGGIKKLLHDDGMTIRGVQKLLREEGVRHVSSLSPVVDAKDGGDVVEAQAVEAPMAVDVAPAKLQNVVPIKAAAPPAPTRVATAEPTATARPNAPVAPVAPATKPELGPRGDVLVGPDETPVTYRAGKGDQAPLAPPKTLGNDVPADPRDPEASPPDVGSVIGALRRANASRRPAVADPRAASDLFRRLTTLRKRMESDPNSGSGSGPNADRDPDQAR